MLNNEPEEEPLDARLRRSVAVVVPAYNPGMRIAPIVAGLVPLIERIYVVDDGSTDGSIDSLGTMPIHIITLPQNRGKGVAMLSGFRAALRISGVTGVAILDADGQHDPADLPAIYEVFERERADLVIGARCFGRENVPLRSRLGNTIAAALTRVLLGVRIPDTQSGFRIYSRRFLEESLQHMIGGRYETEMEFLTRAVKGRYAIACAPIQTIYEPNNPTSHFHAVGDSIRVFRKLLRAAVTRQRLSVRSPRA